MKLRWVLGFVLILGIVGALAWGAVRLVRATSTSASLELPTTKVKRGRVTLTVAARGELQGGNSEMLTAPDDRRRHAGHHRTCANPANWSIPAMWWRSSTPPNRSTASRRRENDLAEAQQQVIKAQAESDGTEEESRWAMINAQNEVKLAELEVRRNPLIAAIVARQNDLALEAARNRERQAVQDYANKKTTSAAGIAIQKAAENKARVMAQTAQRNIDSMTLKAKTEGYVNVQQNQNQNMMYWGMQLPPFQVGDTARAGHGGGADSGPEELGGQRQRRRTRPRPPQRRAGGDHPGGGARRQGVHGQSQEHRRHQRPTLGPPLRMPHHAR